MSRLATPVHADRALSTDGNSRHPRPRSRKALRSAVAGAVPPTAPSKSRRRIDRIASRGGRFDASCAGPAPIEEANAREVLAPRALRRLRVNHRNAVQPVTGARRPSEEGRGALWVRLTRVGALICSIGPKMPKILGFLAFQRDGGCDRAGVELACSGPTWQARAGFRLRLNSCLLGRAGLLAHPRARSIDCCRTRLWKSWPRGTSRCRESRSRFMARAGRISSVCLFVTTPCSEQGPVTARALQTESRRWFLELGWSR